MLRATQTDRKRLPTNGGRVGLHGTIRKEPCGNLGAKLSCVLMGSYSRAWEARPPALLLRRVAGAFSSGLLQARRRRVASADDRDQDMAADRRERADDKGQNITKRCLEAIRWVLRRRASSAFPRRTCQDQDERRKYKGKRARRVASAPPGAS